MTITSRQRIDHEIARIAALPEATVGVVAQHIQTGVTISYNPARAFPMASTYKIAIAIYLLTQVEIAHISLDTPITITPADISPGSGIIKDRLHPPNSALSVEDLLKLMLQISDNTASDVVLRLVGGAAAVTAFVSTQQIGDLRIDRSAKRMLADFYGVADAPADDAWSIDAFRTAFRATTDETKHAAHIAFLADPRDTATPAALCALLVQLQRGILIGSTYRDLLLELMCNSQTGAARLPGLLPGGVTLAHKSGSLGEQIVNDIGIIALPDGGGHIAIAACVAATRRNIGDYERTIAQLSRIVYDYFLLAAP